MSTSWGTTLAMRLGVRVDRSRDQTQPLSEDWRLSDGEIHYLWWYIQGSIMVPEIRWRLRRAWGLCDRHAWGALLGEASYRHGYLHGPTILYSDLMERACKAFDVRGPQKALRIAQRLRDTGPCLMCELDLRSRGAATARAEVLRDGRDPHVLQELATRTNPYWGPTVCGRCADHSSSVRCRIHFREDALRHGSNVDLRAQRMLLEWVTGHLLVYSQSFVWGHQGTESDEDHAALISAVGWCSGWRGLLTIRTSGTS